jgi:hypothetical protein
MLFDALGEHLLAAVPVLAVRADAEPDGVGLLLDGVGGLLEEVAALTELLLAGEHRGHRDGEADAGQGERLWSVPGRRTTP